MLINIFLYNNHKYIETIIYIPINFKHLNNEIMII